MKSFRERQEALAVRFQIRLGQEAGSTAIISYSASPLKISPANGEIKPPRLEPPPAQPIIISALIPYLSNAAFVSRPITGYFDMVAYQRYNDGEMQDYIPTDEELEKAISKLPKVEL